MATLTLFFGGRILQVFHLDQERIRIGRNRSCDISIDHAKLDEQHAEIRRQGQHYRISALSGRYPLIVNLQATEAHLLQSGDTIQIGDFTLTFAESGESGKSIGEDMLNELMQSISSLPTGHVQILNGPGVGRILQLNRSLTRLGSSGHECAVIAHRKNGYFLAHLEGKQPVRVNDQPIGDHTVRLQDGNLIQISHTLMRFHDHE